MFSIKLKEIKTYIKMEKAALKIKHQDGSVQIVNVSDKFDGDYYSLAHDIAKVAKPEYDILREKSTKQRNKN